MENVYTEKEILGDALNTQKSSTNLYNMSANECVHNDLRNTLTDLLDKEREIQVSVFNEMHAKGFYPTPDADAKKMQDAKNKFQCSFKAVSK